MGMRKINTIGIKQANKVMQMAAMAYNLKKLLKFINKSTQAKKQGLFAFLNRLLDAILAKMSLSKPLYFSIKFN